VCVYNYSIKRPHSEPKVTANKNIHPNTNKCIFLFIYVALFVRFSGKRHGATNAIKVVLYGTGGKKLKNDSQKSAANLIYLFDFIRKKCQITEKHHNK